MYYLITLLQLSIVPGLNAFNKTNT